MKIYWKQGTTELIVYEEGKEPWHVPCFCRVRTLKNGLRKPNQVVYTKPHGKPYQPVIFPVGTWKVGNPLPRSTDEIFPYFIPTDAFKMVKVWETFEGAYVKETEEEDKDEAYGLHSSTYRTSLGCIVIKKPQDCSNLAVRIEAALKREEEVFIEVEEEPDAVEEG